MENADFKGELKESEIECGGKRNVRRRRRRRRTHPDLNPYLTGSTAQQMQILARLRPPEPDAFLREAADLLPGQTR